MKRNTKLILAAALVSGLATGAMANEGHHKGKAKAEKASCSGKEGCGGKEKACCKGKDKNKCKGEKQEEEKAADETQE